jgi:thioredoxin reductase (NADPH)
MTADPRAMECLDVIIVGGGPAGLTAATYMSRFMRSCLVIDAGSSRARWIPESNNCPGFPQGVSGTELLRRMMQQALAFKTTIQPGHVDGITRNDSGFVVSTATNVWRAKIVILATGIADNLPAGEWVEKAIACHALRLCSICDAYEASDTKIGVYGPLEGIVSHAMFLRSYSSRVFMIPNGPVESGRRAQEVEAHDIVALPAGGRLVFDGQKCAYEVNGDREVFDCVYPYMGSRITSGIVDTLGARRASNGELRVDREQMTDVPGLYAIGDVVSGLNQISVAVGQAAVAATAAHRMLPFSPR